jgi:hypothetical protein
MMVVGLFNGRASEVLADLRQDWTLPLDRGRKPMAGLFCRCDLSSPASELIESDEPFGFCSWGDLAIVVCGGTGKLGTGNWMSFTWRFGDEGRLVHCQGLQSTVSAAWNGEVDLLRHVCGLVPADLRKEIPNHRHSLVKIAYVQADGKIFAEGSITDDGSSGWRTVIASPEFQVSTFYENYLMTPKMRVQANGRTTETDLSKLFAGSSLKDKFYVFGKLVVCDDRKMSRPDEGNIATRPVRYRIYRLQVAAVGDHDFGHAQFVR